MSSSYWLLAQFKMAHFLLTLCLTFALLAHCVSAKRRPGVRTWDFEAKPGMGNSVGKAKDEQDEDEEKERKADDGVGDKAVTEPIPPSKISSTTSDIDKNEISNEFDESNRNIEQLNEQKEDEEIRKILEQSLNMTEDTFEEEQMPLNTSLLLTDMTDKKILWVDANFKADDLGLNVSEFAKCKVWRRFWAAKNAGNSSELGQFKLVKMGNETDEEVEEHADPWLLVEFELIEDSDRIKHLLPTTELLEDDDEYDAVGILYSEICAEYERDFFYKTPEDAKSIGMDNETIICDPFKKELHPNIEQLNNLENALIAQIENAENNASSTDASPPSAGGNASESLALSMKRRRRQSNQQNAKMIDDTDRVPKMKQQRQPKLAKSAPEIFAEEGEVASDEEELEEMEEEQLSALNRSLSVSAAQQWAGFDGRPIQIDTTDETNPLLLFASHAAARALNLHIPPRYFQRYQKVGLHLPGICSEYVPSAIESFNASEFEGVEIEGPIGVNITALLAAGVNLTELAEKLRNDTEVDQILSRTQDINRPLGGSYILPVLNKNQYDPFSPPIVFQGSAVVVRFGIYIESMSNFQTTTMDYDMDIYLIMGWRDPRLVNNFGKPVLVKEEDILEKIWRPDPFFDAKEAEFHEVTFLNFLMRIYSDGLILYETRIKMKPACNLVLCKYPHDKQTCELQIKSFAYAAETVRFEWFTNRLDAIDKNPDVRLPELYIDQYEPAKCNRSRKSGEFACLRAVFRLKRDVGFHIAQTYIPTSLALMFSWVGVWLPEEFMEGRIGVAITVLLTLSTESAGAREHLPSVSYLKAIDLWFGYITGFVFLTLLQTLVVIGLDKRANQLRKWATKKRIGKAELSREARDAMADRAARYHKLGRYLDNCCRVFYPLSFSLFLIFYYFVFTEGQQDDCIADR
ncbi:hypothetical protein niasHS_005380 [Heterodera schachtii]|uniref:Uncharacterized protein n=1 Tax=Heterodera schachtii TaxID=97005 RepID=A0ABD2J961_HETSC